MNSECLKHNQNNMFMPGVFFCLGIPRGFLFTLTIWASGMWMKCDGYSNTAVGLCSLLIIPSFFKLFLLPYFFNINARIKGVKSYKTVFFLIAIVFFSLAIIGAVCATPSHIAFFLLCVTFAAVAASLVELMLEILRVDAALFGWRLCSNDKIAAYMGSGACFGSVIGRTVLLLFVAVFSWPIAIVLMVVIMALLAMTILRVDCYWQKVKGERNKHYSVREGLEDLRQRWGNLSLWCPLLLVLNESFMRPMISIMLVDLDFSISEIAVAHIVTYIGGVVGSYVMIVFFPKMHDVDRVLWSGCMNAFVGMSFSLLLVWCHYGVMLVLMFATGVVQNIFLQILRVMIGVFCSRKHQFVQLAFLLSMWSAGALLASFSGLLVDAIQWVYYFFVIGLLYIPGVFSLCVLRKKIKKQYIM